VTYTPDDCDEQEKELTQFVDITKHLNGIDRSQMLLQLMRLHGEMLSVNFALTG